MKKCTICKEEKDLTEYYKGHGKCKKCFIKRVMENDNDEKRYFLIVDNSSILNFEYRSVRHRNDLVNLDFTVVWSKSDRL